MSGEPLAGEPPAGAARPARSRAVAVAICTRDRPAELRRALRSLMRQEPAVAEILVVDNAPTSDSIPILLHDEFPCVRYLREPIAGLDFARNRALNSATAPVVAFLDDDAVADPGWAASIASAFRDHPRLGVCTGRVEPLALETAAQRLFEANGGFSRGRDPIRLPADASRRLHGRRAPLIAWAVSIGSGCSFAVDRGLALGLGGFDEALDMGAELPGGGDHDMLWRVLQAGREVLYEPRALAWHEHRREVTGVHAQIAGHQRALVAMLAKSIVRARGRARLGLAAFLGWRLVKPGARLLRRLAGRDPLPASLLLRMWWECWRGLGAYPLARRRAARRRALQGAARATIGAGSAAMSHDAVGAG